MPRCAGHCATTTVNCMHQRHSLTPQIATTTTTTKSKHHFFARGLIILTQRVAASQGNATHHKPSWGCTSCHSDIYICTHTHTHHQQVATGAPHDSSANRTRPDALPALLMGLLEIEPLPESLLPLLLAGLLWRPTAPAYVCAGWCPPAYFLPATGADDVLPAWGGTLRMGLAQSGSWCWAAADPPVALLYAP